MSGHRRRQLHLVLVLMLLGAIAEMVAIGAVIPFLSVLSNPERAADLPLLSHLLQPLGATTRAEIIIACAALFAAAAILAAIVRLCLSWTSQSFIFRLGHDVGLDIQRRILAQEYSFHISRNTSEVLASLEKVQVLVSGVLLQLMLAATSLVIACFIMAALFWVDPLVATVSVTAFAAMYLPISLYTRRWLRRASVTFAKAFNDRVRILQESLGGIRDIIIDQSQRIYLAEFDESDGKLQRERALTAFIGAAPRFMIEAAGMILIGLLATLISLDGGFEAAVPVLGALALGAQRLLPLVQQVYLGWTSIAANRSVVGDVLGLLRLPVPSDASLVPEPLPFREEIRFDRVSFRYPSRTDAALENIDFSVPRGARAALIGTTGSGKSTLVDLLMGLLEPSSGAILIDGEPVWGPARRSWQRNIAHVPQSIFLNDGTVARNIAFGSLTEEIDKERLIDASRIAQLHDFIISLPDGYDTIVGERGVRLSGGQRQRLGIARALYKGAPVLILDEATSALDQATEAALMHSLESLRNEGLTIIMIAHRLSTVQNCDLIVRLERGRVAQIGSYAEVVEGGNGLLESHES